MRDDHMRAADLALECAAVDGLELRELRETAEVYRELLLVALERLHAAHVAHEKSQGQIRELRAQLRRAGPGVAA